MADERKSFKVEGARLIYRNFEGKEGKYNTKGDRNFCVILPDDVAAQMDADGWNIRMREPREEGDPPEPYVQVKVNFDRRPPRIVMLTSTTRTQLDEDSVEVLDWADIINADLIARGSDWNVGGKTGVAAYLQTLFVTIEEDELERKYAIYEDAPGHME